MKTLTIIFVLFLSSLCISLTAQSLRYFEFKTLCYTNGNNTWQDSSFIAATANPILVDSILADLARPDTLRKMIIGQIDSGNAGYNHNATHWFLWHFIENEWDLTQGAIELCDGCPTNVDTCVPCFMGIHSFCPWSSHVAREVNVSAINEYPIGNDIFVYPNPVSEILEINMKILQPTYIIINDLTSRELIGNQFTGHVTLNVDNLKSGIYFYRLSFNNKILKMGKIIKN